LSTINAVPIRLCYLGFQLATVPGRPAPARGLALWTMGDRLPNYRAPTRGHCRRSTTVPTPFRSRFNPNFALQFFVLLNRFYISPAPVNVTLLSNEQ